MAQQRGGDDDAAHARARHLLLLPRASSTCSSCDSKCTASSPSAPPCMGHRQQQQRQQRQHPRRRRSTALAIAIATVAALMAAACLPVADARVSYSRLFRDDRPLIAMAPDFGFAARGRVELRVADIAIWTPHDDDRDAADLSRFGFVLLNPAAAAFAGADGAPAVAARDGAAPKSQCLLDGGDGVLLTFDRPEVARVVRGKAPNATLIVDVEDGGWAQPFFVSCERGAAVSLRAVVAAYNVRPGDGRRAYLGVGETPLVALYWTMFALFAAFFVGWCALLVARRASVHKVHGAMAALLLAKALTLLAEAAMTQHVGATGGGAGWGALYHLLTAARGLLLFTVIVLLGTGWGVMRPFLDDRARQVLLAVVPLQVAANVALLVVDEESPAMAGWLSWRQLLTVADLACCLFVLLPLVWQMKQLQEAAHLDGKAAQSLSRLRLLRAFYVAVVAYVYFTRVVVALLRDALDYRQVWLADAASEGAALAFYLLTFYAFRPGRAGAYASLVVTDEDLELATRY